jgi:hypothetical protein
MFLATSIRTTQTCAGLCSTIFQLCNGVIYLDLVFIFVTEIKLWVYKCNNGIPLHNFSFHFIQLEWYIHRDVQVVKFDEWSFPFQSDELTYGVEKLMQFWKLARGKGKGTSSHSGCFNPHGKSPDYTYDSSWRKRQIRSEFWRRKMFLAIARNPTTTHQSSRP